jgi:hypothetical protein
MPQKRKIVTLQEVARDVRKGELETPVEIRYTAENSPYGKAVNKTLPRGLNGLFRFVLSTRKVVQRVRNCLRDDLVCAPAELHEMVNVNRFLDGIKNVPKENKIAALERASRSFVMVLA